jgi:hypothetical protein
MRRIRGNWCRRISMENRLVFLAVIRSLDVSGSSCLNSELRKVSITNMTDMFYEGNVSPPDVQNVTLVVTRTAYLTVTSTISTSAKTPAPTTTTLTSNTPQLGLEVPHFPQVDTAFTALFGCICIILTAGVVFRRKSKKLKSFNIPLIVGAFCTLLTSNLTQSTH